ncbi:MAG: hypothetical protein IKB73_06765 [Ruminococcus sp.]|nr:hypothetical protein [Ruminococcus sp.]
MKYCSSCKKLYNGENKVCTECNKKYKEIKDINEPVLLCVVGGVERSMICGALSDAQIPYVEKQYGKLGVTNETVTGYDAKLLNIAIEVPYSAIPKAYGVLKSVGLDSESVEDVIEVVEKDVDDYKKKLSNQEETTMSSAKRTTVKVLSLIAFLILIALVVLGTDYVMQLLKDLFENLLGG